MGISGQNNFKGINSQAWASMSLFLQFLRDPKFSHIHLEAPGFEDFNLIFDDGRKIICESKARKEKFSYPQLKEVLKKVTNKNVVGDRDEILIVCNNANREFVSAVKNVKFFETLRDNFKKKGYTDKLVSLLPKVEFWIPPTSFNEQIIYSLFAGLIDFWLPPQDIKEIIDSILLQKIYKGSATGGTYSRADILNEIDNLKNRVVEDSGYYDTQRIKREQQFRNLEKDIRNTKSPAWAVGQLKAFSTKYDRMAFVLDRIKNRQIKNLKAWDNLWKLNNVYYFAFGIFNVFEYNLHTEQNKKYILNYIKKYVKDIRGFYRPDFFDVNVVKIIAKIIEGNNGNKYLKDAFGIAKDLITLNEKEFFYLKDRGYDLGQWKKGEICKLLHKIYDRADAELKKKIFNLVVSGFNITEDDGEFSHHAPREVYEILREWFDEDFSGRFPKLVKVISDQYNRFYRTFSKKNEFMGWEHCGGGISFGGSNYHLSDRHFIGFILAPAIKKFYDIDNNQGWQFMKSKCITKTKSVSKTRPDFLNRSVYEIVLSRYASDDRHISKEAFGILKEFILSGERIPSKSALIYQAILGSSMSDDKKWKLVELTTKKCGIPINPFAEQIVAGLAGRGHQEAKNELKKWFADPKYYGRFMFHMDSVASIRTLLDPDLDLAIELFKLLITSDHLKSGKGDLFDAFDVAVLLYDIIKKDYTKALTVLRSLEAENELSRDQQIIYSFSLFNYHGNDESDDPRLLMDIYRDVVDPFLRGLSNDINNIYKRLPWDSCREAFVHFAVRLAVKKQVAEALRIIRIFVDDPNPYLPGRNPNDQKDELNEHKRIESGEEPHTITSTRGWCGWALMQCTVLNSREQIPEIIELSNKLAKDENYYVVHMACFALAQIAGNRLTVLPSDANTLFFNDNKEVALRMAKKVENIAFELLKKLISWPVPVQKAMAKSILHVFNPIRALNEADSLKLVTALSKLPKEAMEESAPLLIYYAELRKEAYKKWRFSLPGLYDDLGPDRYDSTKFKEILIKTIETLQKQEPDSCFHFAAHFEHMMRDAAVNNNEIEKYTKLALEYFDLLTNFYGHSIFILIYQVIQNKLEKPDNHLTDWYKLLIKCLKTEKEFYEKENIGGNIARVYWYPTLYHSKILELINDRMDQDKFMQAAKIFFSFPKELELNESDKLVSIVKNFSKTDKDARKIVNYLIDKNPSKYWNLRDCIRDKDF